jgi:L-2,4-diaminobutyric acid acetyltransferase
MDVVCEAETLDDTTQVADAPLVLRAPEKHDGRAIHDLIARCEPLDLNSVYTYLLLAEHFSPTCVLAHERDQLRGFVSAYIPPGRPDVLFVWQVAVHRQARGRGLGPRMLRHLLGRPGLEDIRYMETTVGPSNRASRRMFARVAGSLGAPVRESRLFSRSLFGPHGHDDEPLLRIGPFDAH